MNIKIPFIKNNYYLTIKSNYCGAIAECKKHRNGENWLRGNDLRDGKIYELPKVILDMICYEFSLGRWANTNKCRIA